MLPSLYKDMDILSVFYYFSFSGLVVVSPCGLQLEWLLPCTLVCTVKTHIFI